MNGTGAQAIIAVLDCLGVQRVFGMPGVQTLELFDALADAPFDTVLTTDERSAAFMADAHARVTGRLGVLIVTPGPGLTNAMTGLAEAKLDSSPVLALVASTNSELRHAFQLHAMDQAAMLRPVCKAVYAANEVGELCRIIAMAAQAALEGEPGPVAVEVPYNLLATPGSFGIPVVPPAELAEPDGDVLDRMAAELAQSPAVGIYVGNGAQHCAAEVEQLAELLDAPVATTISGRGILPEDHPLSVGFGFGPAGQPVAQSVFRRVHTLLAIGCKYSEPATGSFGMKLPPRHLHIDINPASIGTNYVTQVTLVASAKPAIAGLLRRLESQPRRAEGRLQARIAAARERQACRLQDGKPLAAAVTPSRFLRSLRQAVERDTILVTDSGSHQFWALSDFAVYAPGTFLVPADFQAMGFSIPAAIAAKLARPEQRVISLVGDGGFLLSAMELATAQRLALPLMVLVFRDGALGLIREAQRRVYRRAPFTQLANPNFECMAEAFGMEYVSIGCDAQIEDGLARAMQSQRAVLVDVQVRYEVASQYFKGAAGATFGHLPLDRKARIVARRLWRGITPASDKPVMGP